MITKIKKDIIIALKSGDVNTKDILRVLLGEVQRSFVTKDEDVIKIAKKMVQNIKENNGTEAEIEVLLKYLPKQMDENEMDFKVSEFINENEITSISQLGMIMGHFKKNYDGTYDGKLLSNLIKEKLV